MRRQLTLQPFESKIRKVAHLIQLSRKLKLERANAASDDSFDGAQASEPVLARDWNSTEEDAAWQNL